MAGSIELLVDKGQISFAQLIFPNTEEFTPLVTWRDWLEVPPPVA